MNESQEEADLILKQYVETFQQLPSSPMCVPDELVVKQVRIALEKGGPIPKSYAWYRGLPPGTVA